EIRAGQCLYRSLEHTYQYCQQPEIKLRIQPVCIYCDAEIRRNTDRNDRFRSYFLHKPAEDKDARKGNDLRHQQCQKQSCAIQSQCLPVSCCHVDHCINTINVEEERQQENKDMFLLCQVDKRPAQTSEA